MSTSQTIIVQDRYCSIVENNIGVACFVERTFLLLSKYGENWKILRFHCVRFLEDETVADKKR